jgi:hypothetical protein
VARRSPIKISLDPDFLVAYSPARDAHGCARSPRPLERSRPHFLKRTIAGGHRNHVGRDYPPASTHARGRESPRSGWHWHGRRPSATIHSPTRGSRPSPLATCWVSARTQALLRPIAPGKVTTSFAPLGRVLFWELFLRASVVGAGFGARFVTTFRLSGANESAKVCVPVGNRRSGTTRSVVGIAGICFARD